MKKLLSIFMASALLLGTTNLTAFAGSLIPDSSTRETPLSDKEVSDLQEQAIELSREYFSCSKKDLFAAHSSVYNASINGMPPIRQGTILEFIYNTDVEDVLDIYHIDVGAPNVAVSLVSISGLENSKDDLRNALYTLALTVNAMIGLNVDTVLPFSPLSDEADIAAVKDRIVSDVYTRCTSLINYEGSNRRDKMLSDCCKKNKFAQLLEKMVKIFGVCKTEFGDDLSKLGIFTEDYYLLIIEDLKATDESKRFYFRTIPSSTVNPETDSPLFSSSPESKSESESSANQLDVEDLNSVLCTSSCSTPLKRVARDLYNRDEEAASPSPKRKRSAGQSEKGRTQEHSPHQNRVQKTRKRSKK